MSVLSGTSDCILLLICVDRQAVIFINPATLTSLYDNDFLRVLHAHAHNVAH